MTRRGVQLRGRLSETISGPSTFLAIPAGVVPMTRERNGLQSEMLAGLLPGDPNAPAQHRPDAKSSSTALAGTTMILLTADTQAENSDVLCDIVGDKRGRARSARHGQAMSTK